MPNRYLREGILTSEPVNRLNDAEEVFYRRLMSVVDDFGRFDARPAVLRAACYPLKLANVREADISRHLAACEGAGLIVLYQADGKQFGYMTKVGKPRAESSKFPDPPNAHENGCAQMRARAPDYGNGKRLTITNTGVKKSGAERLKDELRGGP